MQLSNFHADAIRECMNIGIGTVADILSGIVGRPIGITIPGVRFVQLESIKIYLDDNYGSWGSCVVLPFDGGLKGDGVLVFSPESARTVVDLIGDEQLDGTLIADMEGDLLMEVGNILINGCVGSIVNLLGADTTDGLPRYCSRVGGEVLDEILEQDKRDTFGMIITTSLKLEKLDADVHIDLLITFNNACMPIVFEGFDKMVA